MLAEMELSATADPRALVLGDPDALAVTGRRLADLAGAFERTADGLARIEVGRWQGAAADAFRSRFPQAVDQFSTAQSAFGRASSGWERYRQVVAWAQERAAEAVARYEAALAASRVAQDARAADVARYRAALETAAAGQGPPPAPLRPFLDPGPAGMAEARALLDEARARRDGVAAEVADALRVSAASAPDTPSGWEAFVEDVGDLWRGRVDDAGRFLSGVAEGAEALFRTARSMNPGDPWNAAHPAQYAAGLSATAAGVVTSAVHPLRLVKDVVGSGWGTDPATAGGRLVPAVALAALGGGAAARRGAERAAAEEAETAPILRPPGLPPPTRGASPVARDAQGFSTGRDARTLGPSAAGDVTAPIGPPPVPGGGPVPSAAGGAAGPSPAGAVTAPIDLRAAPAGADLAAADDALARRLRVLALQRSITDALAPRPAPPPALPPGLGPVKFVAPVPGIAAEAGAPVSSVPVRDAAGRPVVPAGFAGRKAFEEFGRPLHEWTTAAGYPQARIFMNGSAVSGVKYTTGVPFDLGRTSDFDIAFADKGLYRKAERMGIEVRGDPARTVPLKGDAVERLGLADLQRRCPPRPGARSSS